MPYRDSAGPSEEVLERYDVSVGESMSLVGALGACSLLPLVVLAVTLFAGAPPWLEERVWLLPIVSLAFGIPALMLWKKLMRTLLIVRRGASVHMVVAGEVELTFPLVMTGDQSAADVQGPVKVHRLYLKLVDGAGRGILLLEFRGMIHGAQPGWFNATDTIVVAPLYHLGAAGDAAKIRDRVAAINAELAT